MAHADENAPASKALSRSGGLYPIRTVAALTGVNAVTLRAWERRYGLIKPQRTPKGHRLYSDAQIALIRRVVELVNDGIAIGQVGRFLQDNADTPLSRADAGDPWQIYRMRMLQAIQSFDDQRLENAYNEALSLYPVDLVTRLLILPLMEQLGELWRVRETGVIEEHFFSLFLRNKLGARFQYRSEVSRGPKIMLACLPGEHHEIGILLFCLSAVTQGFRTVLLGANTPLNGLAAAAQAAGVDGIVLSGTACPAPQVLHEDLPALATETSLPVFVGGAFAEVQAGLLRAGGLRVLDQDVSRALSQLNAALKRPGYQGV
ncbi:MerR family transcriptional regulator [Granulosicoccaceae sp. 1_MG-2023]|nr:MerR family transcriptional regulator [Granulosicoccaceae sp. 1_MG-2023]